MKNLIALLIVVFIGLSIKGQILQEVKSLNIEKKFPCSDYRHINTSKNQNNYRAPNDTIMYWDLNGGLPSGWTTIDNTSNNYIWEWSTIGPHGAYTHLSGQPWTVPIDPIASTTAVNGFLMFQADNYNTDQTTGLLVTNIVDHDSYIMTNSIDLSSQQSVLVKFQERFRACCTWLGGNGLFLGVSTNGTTWTDFSVSEGIPINDHSCAYDTVTNVEVNISSIAANQPIVYLRWYIKGLSHYYWMVDDIALVEGLNNDIKIQREYTDFFVFDDGYYTKIPRKQSLNFPIGFRADVQNNGLNNVTNVILNIDVDYLGSIIYSENSSLEDPTPIISGSLSDSIWCLGSDFYSINPPPNPSFYANQYGDYTITHTISMDSTDQYPSDNIAISAFSVTDSIYARDDGSNESKVGPQKWVGYGNDGDIMGITYQINDDSDDSEVNSISIFVTDNSDTINPTTIRGALYISNGLYDFSEVIYTNTHTITSADLNNWITIPFVKNGVSEILPSGKYLAGVVYESFNGGNGMWIGEDRSTNQVESVTHWNFIQNSQWVYLTNYGFDQTPMIRLNFNPCMLNIIDSLTYITDESTCGIGDGAIDLTVDYGNPPISFLWSNGATTEDISGLTGGQYSVIITDNEGCQYNRNFTVNSLNIPSFSANTTDESSCGLHDGSIDITPSGGTSPYIFLWSNDSTTEDLINITNGAYTLTMTDQYGCSFIQTYNISYLDSVTTLGITSNESFCGFSDGSIDITIYNGSSPYTINWSNGSTDEDLINIGGGSYSVSITDNNGCSSFNNFSIIYLDSLSITGTTTDESFCGFSDGSVDITINNGSSPYTFNWSNGSTNEDLINVGEGSYSISVTDDHGCSNVNSFSIVYLDSLSIDGTTTDESFCGFSDGSVDITINNGSSPYTFSWSNGSTNEDLINVGEGLYSISVTDNYGCSNFNSFSIVYIDSLSIMLDSIIHSSGPAFSTGAIYISIVNGTPPYSILWSNAATTEDITGLLGGGAIGDSLVYSVEIIDSNGCINNASFYIYSLNVSDISSRVFDVSQNYPNPFGNMTQFDIEITGSMNISYEITDITGKKLTFENKGILTTGRHIINIDASSLADGIYYYTVKADDNTYTRKMVIIK
ncbi:MAG: T9SS type A sorting domain-containing protein [Bacteroidota bacterium]